MAKTGKAVPTSEKLSTAHREHTLIDILSDGIRPNMNVPKPCADVTARSPSRSIFQMPPSWGKPSIP